MVDERFNWNKAGRESGAIELKKRNIWRILTKDSNLCCLVCGKHPKRNDHCYYPAKGLATTNKIIGHRDCVDRVVNQVYAHESGARRSANDAVTLTLAQPLTLSGESSRRPVSSTIHADSSTPASPSKSADWYIGWHAGVRFIFERQGLEGGQSEMWMDGFREGILFASGYQGGRQA